MEKNRFAISKQGTVYELEGRECNERGHIASLLHDEGARARELRDWWQARIASDEPGYNVVVFSKWKWFFTLPGEELPFDRLTSDQVCVGSVLTTARNEFVPALAQTLASDEFRVDEGACEATDFGFLPDVGGVVRPVHSESLDEMQLGVYAVIEIPIAAQDELVSAPISQELENA